jgi:hypothetical protein
MQAGKKEVDEATRQLEKALKGLQKTIKVRF